MRRALKKSSIIAVIALLLTGLLRFWDKDYWNWFMWIFFACLVSSILIDRPLKKLIAKARQKATLKKIGEPPSHEGT